MSQGERGVTEKQRLARSSYYAFAAGGFQFRIYRPTKRWKGWFARVMCGGWKRVIYSIGEQTVICPTKREMQAYIRYAYAGIEPRPR